MSTQEDEHAKLLAQANYELSVYGQISEDTADSLADYDSGVKGLSKATKQAYQGVKKLGEAVGKTATAMYEGKEGASAYNGALDSMGDAADNASKALFMLGGPFGMIAGAIAFLIGKAIKATKVVNEQLDNEYKAFQALGKSGAAASDGMTGAFEGMQKLRLGVQDFQKYGELIGKNAKELAVFGGTVAQGRKKFENVSAAMEPYRLSMNRLGMTQDDQNEGLAAYIASETRMGRAQTKTSDQLAEGAMAYLKEQDALTKITGVERSEREAARAEALKEQGYAAKLRSLELNGQTQAVKNFESVNEMMSSLNPEAAKAVRAAMAGNLSSAEAQKVFGSSAGKVMELNEKLEKNLIQPAEYAQEISKAIGEQSDRVGSVTGQFEQWDKNNISFAASQLLRKKAEGDFFKNYEEAMKETAKQAEGKVDPLLDDMAKTQKANTDSMVNAQKAVQAAAPAASKAMLTFAEATASATDNLVNADDKAAKRREEYNKQQEKIKKQQEEAAKKWSEDMPWWLGGDKKETPAAAAPATKPTAQPTPQTQPQTQPQTTPQAQQQPTPQPTPKPIPQPSAPKKDETAKAPTLDKFVTFKGGSADRNHWDMLDAGFQTSLLKALEAYQAKGGGKLNLESAVRSDDEQLALYNRWLKGQPPGVKHYKDKGAIASFDGVTTPAMPMSLGGAGNHHMKGLAIDAGRQAADINGKIKLADFGLKWGGDFTKPDPVHIQRAAEGGVFPATPGGQQVLLAEAGQDEAVIPMKDGAVQVSMKNPGPMSDMAYPDIDAMLDEEFSSTVSADIREDLRAVVMDIVRQIQPVSTSGSGMSQAVLDQLDQLIAYQKEANDIDNRMLSVASN